MRLNNELDKWCVTDLDYTSMQSPAVAVVFTSVTAALACGFMVAIALLVSEHPRASLLAADDVSHRVAISGDRGRMSTRLKLSQ